MHMYIIGCGLSPIVILLHCYIIIVPADPPGNMTVVALSSTAAEIEWRSPQTPNGVILYYTIYIDGAPVSNVSASSGDTSATVNGLSPNRQITVSVSASTKIGEGPVSPEQTVTTHESCEITIIIVYIALDHHK